MMPLAFGFGNPIEWVIIAAVALIVFGPGKMPELGRQLGQMMRDFRKVADEFTGAASSVRDEVESVYRPMLTDHTTSSATVEQAMTQRPYDSEPEELAAIAPAKPAGVGLTLSTLPPAATDSEDAKGY